LAFHKESKGIGQSQQAKDDEDHLYKVWLLDKLGFFPLWRINFKSKVIFLMQILQIFGDELIKS
jgi:hypothetical protein